MFRRVGFGWELAKQSFRVFNEDKRLIIFPLLSMAACMVVLATFAVPLWGMPEVRAVVQQRQVPKDALSYIVLFLFYFANYFVVVFFNSALVSCAIMRFRGGQPTIGDGLRFAMTRLPQIVGWALLSATVGFILQLVESKSEKVGQIVSGLLGMAWSIVTYLVVPILVVEKANPIEAIKRSTALLKKTWGEALTAEVSTGTIFFVVFLVALLPLVAFMGLGIFGLANNQAVLGAVALAVAFLIVIAISLVSSTMNTILLAAVYVYAAEGRVPEAFDRDLLEGAFRAK